MRKLLSDTILDLGKCPNRKTYTFTFIFRLAHFLRSKIEYEGIFLIKHYIITSQIFFGVFRPIFNKFKKLISHFIFKSCAEGFKGFFQARKLIFVCQMACIYLLNSRGGPRCLDFVITTYRYPLKMFS